MYYIIKFILHLKQYVLYYFKLQIIFTIILNISYTLYIYVFYIKHTIYTFISYIIYYIFYTYNRLCIILSNKIA